MGSNSLSAIRRQTLQNRDQRMQHFIPYFRQILRQSKFTQAFISNIINADLVSLVQLLNSHQVTSSQLVAIYGLRVIFIGRGLGAITEDYFQFALNTAEYCDKHRKESGKRNWTMQDGEQNEKYLPALFGVPISIKDNLEMAGTRSTVGLTKRANIIIKNDGALVKCFKNGGMIPFVKTNIPQLGFTTQTNNLLWGRCLNPWNKNKSSGGSSGGEAACIAARISPIGIGNDIGGSVRIPAHFCGITALLPSVNRIMKHNVVTKYSLAFDGKDFIKNQNGPLARSVDSLALWMHVATNESFYDGSHDPYIKLIPFDFKLYRQVSDNKKRLRIGYFQHLEFVQCSPACLRGVRETVQFLREDGHELVKIKIPFENEVIFTMMAESMGEGGLACFKDMLQGQPFAPQYKMMNVLGYFSGYSFHILKFLIGFVQPRVAILMEAVKKLNTHQYLQKIGRGHQLRAQWIKFWRNNQLDFVVCAGFGTQATNHGTYDKVSFLAAYTFIWNILAMTACTVPVTMVQEDEQYYESKWNDEFTKGVKYTVKDSKGLPVGVQIIGLPFEQERVLGLSRRIEKHFKFNEKHPFPSQQIDYGLGG